MASLQFQKLGTSPPKGNLSSFYLHKLGQTAKERPSTLSVPRTINGKPVSYPPTEVPDLGWRRDFDEACTADTVVGRGSAGVVRSGTELSSGQVVAVKIMPKVVGALPRGCRVDDIAKEARHIDLLGPCSSVVSLHGCYEGDTHAALVMEMCSGGDLESHVQKHGALDEHGLRLVSVEVMKMLEACHDLGIVHGDIKPSNFCLKEGNNPLSHGVSSNEVQPWLKAVDFGSSADLPLDGSSLRKWVGTPTFMAPEVYRRDYSCPADMWSAGVMLYWLFTKRYPFFPGSECDCEDIAVAVMEATIPYDGEPWSSMSDEGKDFVQRCLQRDEKLRMSAREAMEHPWLVMNGAVELIEERQMVSAAV